MGSKKEGKKEDGGNEMDVERELAISSSSPFLTPNELLI